MSYDKITSENLNEFVITFYENILEDKVVSPFFIELLGDDINNDKWQEHIEILTEFWSVMVLKEGDYFGSPFSPHTTMNLRRDVFDQWMAILKETTSKLYKKEQASQINQVGQIICDNFMDRLKL